MQNSCDMLKYPGFHIAATQPRLLTKPRPNASASAVLCVVIIRVLIRKAQECCMGYQGKFGNGAVLPVITLVSQVALLMQEHTQMAGVRPFGVSLLIASVEADESHRHSSDGAPHSLPVQPRLYRLEPSGSYSAWKACAIGKGSAEAEAIMEEEFSESMDRNRALQLVLSVALRCSPNDGTTEDDVALAFVEHGTIETAETLNY